LNFLSNFKTASTVVGLFASYYFTTATSTIRSGFLVNKNDYQQQQLNYRGFSLLWTQKECQILVHKIESSQNQKVKKNFIGYI